jgi:hypothetical protein
VTFQVYTLRNMAGETTRAINFALAEVFFAEIVSGLKRAASDLTIDNITEERLCPVG